MASNQSSTSSGDSGGGAKPPQEYTVRVPKDNSKKFVVLKFNQNNAVDFSKCNAASLVRENNLKEYKLSNDLDQMPKFGAGSEYGRDMREEARRKKYGIMVKKYNPEDQPWILKSGQGKQAKKYKGVKEGGILENASYYIFTQCADGAFEAFPVTEWYNFTPMIKYKYLNSEEAEEEFSRRDKILNHFTIMTKKRLKNEEDNSDDEEEKKNKGKAKGKSKSKDFLLTELDEWAQLTDEESDDDEDGPRGSDDEKPKKKKEKKSKKPKKKTSAKRNSDDEALEDSDDLNEGEEVDYMTDTDSEDDNMYAESATMKTDKYEEKGIDQEVNSEEEEEEEEPKKEEEQQEEDDQEKTTDKKGSDSESSDSGSESDPEKEVSQFSSALFMPAGKKKSSSKPTSRSATPTKLPDGTDGKAATKKRKPAPENEGAPAKKSKSDAPAPSGSDGIIEEIIRKYLTRKPMTIKDLLQKLHKTTGIQKDKLSETIGPILHRINPERQKINDKLHLHIKKDER